MPKISVLTPSIRPAGLEITRKCLMEQSFQDFEWLIEIGVGRHDLNAAYNRMLKRAKGELVVSIQDFIKFPPDYLQKFWDAHQERPDTFFTAPVGKVDNLDYTGDARWDWRAWTDGEENPVYRPCRWNCWEIDSAAAPTKLLKALGGFDETLDGHWSSDNVNVGKRADLAGHKFANLFTNPSLAFDHDAHILHPFRQDFDPAFNTKRMAMFEGGMTLPPL